MPQNKKTSKDLLITYMDRAVAKAPLLAKIFQSAPDGVILIDQYGTVLGSNIQADKLFDYMSDELRGKKLSILVPDRFRQKHAESCVGFFADTNKEKIKKGLKDFIGVRKDGSEFPVDIGLGFMKTKYGKISIVSVRDISWRKKNQAALVKSYQELENALEGTINVLSTVAGKRDPYTAGHQQRVAKLAYAIAKAIGLDEEQAHGNKVVGLLHDVGKIAVPMEILSKPGKITTQEFEIIKTHPKEAYDILKDVEFPWPVAEAALQHLERLDGSGYPQGLKRDQIIFEARILAVADVVEAMASHRPYRPALGVEAALNELLINKGKLFDPKVVDVTVRLFKEKGFKFD